MECSTSKDEVITFPLHLSKQILQNARNLLMEYLLGPLPLLHTRTMMTLFTFRLPFFANYFIYNACRTLLYPCS